MRRANRARRAAKGNPEFAPAANAVIWLRLRMKTRTLNDASRASDPGQLSLSHAKLKVLCPELYGFSGFGETLKEIFRFGWPKRIYIGEQLQFGDSRAAVVVSTAPLLVAAYSDELDCVAMLEFPASFVPKYDLKIQSRLLTVNCYGAHGEYPEDFILGPRLIERYTRFHPLIAEFLSDDSERIEARKKAISAEEWERATRMGMEYLHLRPGVTRDGRPLRSTEPRAR